MNDTEDQAWAMTLEIAQHQRIDPMTRTDRCTCGYKAELGRMFSHHIAKLIVNQGWRKP